MDVAADPTPITGSASAAPAMCRARRRNRCRAVAHTAASTPSGSAWWSSDSSAAARPSPIEPTRAGMCSPRQASAMASATSSTWAWADNPDPLVRNLITAVIRFRPVMGTPSALTRIAASSGWVWACARMALISVACACRSRLSCWRASRRPSASVVAVRSTRTVSVPPGGAPQTRMTRPQSSPRAPTMVISQPEDSSYAVRAGWLAARERASKPSSSRAGSAADGQRRPLPEDLAGSRAGHGQVGEHLMQPGGRPQLRELILDDQGVDRLGDRDERDLLLEDDQRQPVILRRLDEAGRQAAGIPAAQLDRHRTHADSGEVGDVRIQQRRRLGQRDPGGQHQLAAAQQPRRVGQLDRVHPAHRRVQPPGTPPDAGPPSPDSVERQDLCHRPQHDASPAVTYIVSGSGCRIFQHDEPGPGRLGSMSELHERHRRVIPNWVALYYDDPLELVSGSGSRVTDATGRTYLDFFCGILTNMLGYDVP